jgi:hypothetical protein
MAVKIIMENPSYRSITVIKMNDKSRRETDNYSFSATEMKLFPSY